MSTTNGKSERKSDTLVVPKHGRGLIKQGGDHPRPGRPPNELRGTLRDILERGLPALEGFVEGRVPVKMVGKCEKCGHEHEDYELLPTDMMLLQTVKATDRLKALEIAARYGGVDKLALVLDEQPEKELTPERVKSLWAQLEMIKDIKQFEKMLVAAAAKQIEVDE